MWNRACPAGQLLPVLPFIYEQWDIAGDVMQKWAVELEINAWMDSRLAFFPLDQTPSRCGCPMSQAEPAGQHVFIVLAA